MKAKKSALLGMVALAMCLPSCGSSKEASEAVREGVWHNDATTILVYNPLGSGGYYEFPSIEQKESRPYAGNAWLYAYMVEGAAIHLDLESKSDSSRFIQSYYNLTWMIEKRK